MQSSARSTFIDFCYCRGSSFLEMMQFLSELKRGECEEVKVRVDRLQVFLSTSCIEHLDHIPDEPEESQDRSIRYAYTKRINWPRKLVEIYDYVLQLIKMLCLIFSSSRISILSAVTEMSAVHLLEDDPFVHDPQLANVRSVVYRPNEILAPSYLPLVSDWVNLILCVFVHQCYSHTYMYTHTRTHTHTHTHLLGFFFLGTSLIVSQSIPEDFSPTI